MRRLLATFAAAALLVCASAEAKQPNIVLILVDDLGYGDLSSYGATDLLSPRIDSLGDAGIRLNQFYANCPVCSPTRAALLTGRYPDLVGVPGVIRTKRDDSWGYLDPHAKLLPSILRQAGYHTAIVGKWHLGLESPNRPHERGFDLFHGFLGDMMDDYNDHRRHGINYMRRNDQVIDPEGHATDLFSDWAIDYIREQSQETAPFFLYLAYNAPHTPIQPPARWLERVHRREPEISEQRAKLVAFIEHMDHGIGRVIDALKETDSYENTLLVFTSDNGGQLGVGANCGALRGGKQDMYEGGIKVPMFAVWPGFIEPGSRSPLVGITMDLYPTLCAAAGISVEHKIEGVSVLPTLRGKTQAIERDLFWMRREGNDRYIGQDHYAVRRGDWKLLHNNPHSSLELYNLAEDPLEQRNVFDEQRDVARSLSRALRRQIQRAGAVAWQPPN